MQELTNELALTLEVCHTLDIALRVCVCMSTDRSSATGLCERIATCMSSWRMCTQFPFHGHGHGGIIYLDRSTTQMSFSRTHMVPYNSLVALAMSCRSDQAYR